jgi:hypothetical protein
MAAMPHLVEMHKKYADKGLVVITVSVDPPNDKGMVKAANGFLKKIDSPFRNLLLDESDEVWSKKLDFNTPPCYYVFDRHGKWVRFRSVDFDDGVPYAEMDRIIVQMLNDK